MIDGYQPGQDGFALTPENRPAVQAWLKAQGLDPARVDGMRDDTLFKAYRWPAYLKQMKTRADYYPPCSKENKPCPSVQGLECAAPANDAAKSLSLSGAKNDGGTEALELNAAHTKAATVKSSKSNTPSATSRAGTPSPDPATALHSFLASVQAAQGPGLTEARVVELIREHAPLIISEMLNNARA